MPVQPTPPQIQIDPYSDTDLDLLRRNNAPGMTEHLGGPETEEKVLNRHHRYVALRDPGTAGMFRVSLLPGGEAAGLIGYWERETPGETVYELGWGVLPEFQGRGIGAAATAAVIDHARAQRKHRYVHAYPSVDNPPSNAICRKLGFELMGESDFEYPPGNKLRCNDWRLDLTASSGSPTP